jgi:membrane fusion protein (multidrug efflux system)
VRAYLYVTVLLLLLFGSIGAYLAQQFAAREAMDFTPPPVTIAASHARTEQWRTYLNTVGTITATRGIDLTSEESGEITAIKFESGDRVAQGQLMLVLNDDAEKASRQNQLATLDLARLLFERDQQLVGKKSIPQSQYDRSKADLARAIAQLAETDARLRNKRIRAPFSGTAGIRQVALGDYVSPGTMITTLQDLSELEVVFTVPAMAAPHLSAGLSISLQVDAFPEREFHAVLAAIDSKVDPGTRNLLVQAKVLDSGGLLPGMFAQLQIDLNDVREVNTVPETAISYSLQGSTIFVIKTEGGAQTVESVIVEVGEVREGRVSVIQGLSVDAHVVTAGQNKLYRGASVLIDHKVQL